MAGDPYFSSVSLLCHADGTNGQTTFTDSGPLALSLVRTETNTTVSTAHPKFGSGAINFGTANSSVDTGALTPFQFGTGQFTVEAWAYFTSFGGSNVYVVMGAFLGSSNLQWDFGIIAGSLAFYYSLNGTTNLNVGATYTPTLNTWIHLAVDRDASNVLRVYANGAVIASATVSGSIFAASTTAYNWKIGNDNNFGRAIPGQLDEIRVTKGVARYGGAFTPSTVPFPDNSVLSGTITASSFAQGIVTASLGAVSLGGRIQSSSRASGGGNFGTNLAGRIATMAALNTGYSATQFLAGSIAASSGLSMGLSIRLFGRITTASEAQSRNLAKFLSLPGGRITASSAARLFQLPTPLAVSARITTKSSMAIYDPYHTDPLSIGGRITAASYARLAPPFGQYEAFVVLNLG